MTTFHVERVDLSALVAAMREHFISPPVGPVVGRTNMRDFVAAHLGCSALEAEQLVDTLVTRRFVSLARETDGREVWRLSPDA